MAIWGIHMDRSVGSQPIEKNYVAIGWSTLGDLAAISPNRDAFKGAILQKTPDVKIGSIPVQAGILYRFLYEVMEGDLVVYPSKEDRMVNIGRISGGYQYAPDINPNYPNMRKVVWLKHVSRENFTQAALYEIGSFISLFKIVRHAIEFETASNEQSSNIKIIDVSNEAHDDDIDDASVTKNVLFQAEETAQDFIIRSLKTNIDPYQFEEFTAHLIECLGFHARITAKSADGGVDIIAHKDELGFEPPIIKVQCKQITSNIGRPDVQQLIGSVEQGEHALFITLGGYTREAKDYERSKSNLRLIDGTQLVDLIYSYYEKFSPKYQALIPLKRIYVPDINNSI